MIYFSPNHCAKCAGIRRAMKKIPSPSEHSVSELVKKFNERKKLEKPSVTESLF